MSRLPRSGTTPPGGNAKYPAIALVVALLGLFALAAVYNHPPREEIGEISPHAFIPPTVDEIREARGESVEPPLPPEEEIEGL